MQNMKLILALITSSAVFASPATTSGAVAGKTTQSGSIDGVNGKVTVEGAIAGTAGEENGRVNASGATAGRANGEIDGFGTFEVEGAAAGRVGADQKAGTAAAEGAIAGRAKSSQGYGVEGAAAGRTWANDKGQYGYEGAINGCYKLPNKAVVCWVQSGKSTPGFYDEKGAGYGTLPGNGWDKTDIPKWYNNSTKTTVDTKSTSGAQSMVISIGSLIAGVAALVL